MIETSNATEICQATTAEEDAIDPQTRALFKKISEDIEIDRNTRFLEEKNDCGQKNP